jgi:hypothetical protein
MKINHKLLLEALKQTLQPDVRYVLSGDRLYVENAHAFGLNAPSGMIDSDKIVEYYASVISFGLQYHKNLLKNDCRRFYIRRRSQDDSIKEILLNSDGTICLPENIVNDRVLKIYTVSKQSEKEVEIEHIHVYTSGSNETSIGNVSKYVYTIRYAISPFVVVAPDEKSVDEKDYPTWLKYINTSLDLMRNPLNIPIHSKLCKYKDKYRGSVLWVLSTHHIMIHVDGLWIVEHAEDVKTYACDKMEKYGKLAANEFRMFRNISTV